jgi:acyl carrier protein
MGLDSVELVMNAEEHFGIGIPDHVAETLFTVGDLHGFIVAELDQLGIEPERVVPAARFVQDLGID